MISRLETEFLSLTREIAHSFFKESGLPGKFDFQHWVEQWTILIARGIGEIVVYHENGKIHGIIGMLFVHCTMTGDLEGIEAFWYMMPEHRKGTAGVKLLKTMEDRAKERGCKRIKMMHLSNVNPETMRGIYLRMGYTPVEVAYSKELCQP